MSDFNEIKGQVQGIELLRQALKRQRIAPAYLFFGVAGIGKALTAKEFAKLLLLFDLPDGKKTISTHKIQEGNHPDLLWVEPTYQHQGQLYNAKEASEKGLARKTPPQLRIEQVRQISQFLSRPPLEASRLVVVIEAAHTMTEAAANGLLKTLEEPRKATLILLAPRLDSLISTIVSRCQRIPFYRLSAELMAEILQQKGYGQILQHPELLAIAQGSPGEAIKSSQQWQELPKILKEKLTEPITHPINALKLSKLIAQDLDSEMQLWLIDYLQHFYWQKQQNKTYLELLEEAKKALLSYVQPRLVWECTLLNMLALKEGKFN